MKKPKACFLAMLSAGWLLPLYLAGITFKAYLQTELEPKIMGRPLTHSFPILDVCNFWFAIAAIWLACVIVCWSLYFLRAWPQNSSVSKNKDAGLDTA